MGGVNELRAKWNIEEYEKVITILSRLEKVKGHATLLKALRALNQIPYKLLINGNDAEMVHFTTLKSIQEWLMLQRSMLEVVVQILSWADP